MKPNIDDLITCLKREDPVWWKAIKDDAQNPTNPCFVAVRPHAACIQVYHAGGCVAKIEMSGPACGRLNVSMNPKYMLGAVENPSGYLRLTESMCIPENLVKQLRKWTLADRLHAVKKAAKDLAGEEKKRLQDAIINHNPNIIDLEIAIRDQNELDETQEDSRIDFAAVRSDDRGNPTIVLYEAKTLADPRLRGKGGDEPEVLTQLRRYQKILSDAKWQKTFRERFAAIAKAVQKLELVDAFTRKRNATFLLTAEHFGRIAKGDLTLDTDIWLIGVMKARPEPISTETFSWTGKQWKKVFHGFSTAFWTTAYCSAYTLSFSSSTV